MGVHCHMEMSSNAIKYAILRPTRTQTAILISLLGKILR